MTNRVMNRAAMGIVICLAGTGCDATSEPNGPNGGIAQRFGAVTSAQAAPLGGATLDVTPDGAIAVAADPDRDAVFVVDLASGAVRRIDTNPDDELGQVLIAGDKAFVVARGTGEVLRIDLATASIEQRFFVALGPRGLALTPDGTLHVACASGELVSLDAQTGERTRRLLLDADLRDVVGWGDGLAVSRLRSAEVLFLDGEGQLLERFDPAEPFRGESTVAWRLRVVDSSLVLAHQYTSDTVISIAQGGYGDGGFCTSGITTSMVTLVAQNGQLPSESPTKITDGDDTTSDAGFSVASIEFFGTAGALDVAGASLEALFVAAPGNAWATERRHSLLTANVGAGMQNANSEGCAGETQGDEFAPIAVAVARDTGTVVTQSREPAALQINRTQEISLSSKSRADVGHRMFHLTTSLGISCASCHPEGRDDGHPWNFDQLGMRRSQSLRGGISDLAPFHWDGSLPEFSDLMTEVFQSRMGLDVDPSSAELAGMVDWMDRLPPGEPGPEVDADSAARGQALFTSDQVGCATCHSGPRFADQLSHDVGTGDSFFTPPLTGIGSRPPYMHDSCAPTLKARFGACGGDDRHGVTSQLTDADIDDLVSFMMTL